MRIARTGDAAAISAMCAPHAAEARRKLRLEEVESNMSPMAFDPEIRVINGAGVRRYRRVPRRHA
jgi:hypothetical protein